MKRLVCCILIVVLLLSMAGCSGSADIVGIWEQEMEISILGVESTGSAMSVTRFTFREDGTGIQEQIIQDGSYPDAVRDFTYRLEGDSLTLDYGENHSEGFTAVLGKTSLKLESRRGSYDLKRVE